MQLRNVYYDYETETVHAGPPPSFNDDRYAWAYARQDDYPHLEEGRWKLGSSWASPAALVAMREFIEDNTQFFHSSMIG